jgi:hypothetical protein
MLQLMTLDGGASAAAAAAADLPGRQSGAEAWRQARGETGEQLGTPGVQGAVLTVVNGGQQPHNKLCFLHQCGSTPPVCSTA